MLGCQAITASTTSRPRLMVMLPSDPMDAAVRDRFLRGFATGAHSVAACDAPMPAVRWQDIAPRQSPLQLISPSSGIQLLVAPPSADLRAFAGVSRQRDLPILLPYQRGTSLSTLRGLEERQRLWPLVPSRLDDVRATVAAAMQEGWGRAMVVASPGAVEASVTDQFVDLYRLAGGHVETFEPTPVQRVDPLDQSRFNRFRDDMNWSWVSTVVVADHPDGPLASRLREAQQRGVFGGGAPETPNWVWLSVAEVLTSVPDVPWQQLGLQHPARGEIVVGVLGAAGHDRLVQRREHRGGVEPGGGRQGHQLRDRSRGLAEVAVGGEAGAQEDDLRVEAVRGGGGGHDGRGEGPGVGRENVGRHRSRKRGHGRRRRVVPRDLAEWGSYEKKAHFRKS